MRELPKGLCAQCRINNAVHFYDGYGLCEKCDNKITHEFKES